MSMYIIFPADEIIEILLSSEYSAASSAHKPTSPILPPGPEITLGQSKRSFSSSLTSDLQEIDFCRNSESSSSEQSSDQFPPEGAPRTQRASVHSGESEEKGKKRDFVSWAQRQLPRIQISAPPPKRPQRGIRILKGRPQRVVPSGAEGAASGEGALDFVPPRAQLSPRSLLKRFTFETTCERIVEEAADDDEFISFRSRNKPLKGPQQFYNSVRVSRGPRSPSPSSPRAPSSRLSRTFSWKGSLKRMSSKDSSVTGLSSIVEGLSLRDLLHPNLNESLKAHNALTFKLIRIVSDFTQQLSTLHDQHSAELQLLVENFRKRHADIRKERPPCSSTLFQVWETLLQEVEIDSQAHSDVAGSLSRQVARQLLEKTFCRKIQSRKIFTHRESFETLLTKTENLLSNAYRDYCEACQRHVEQGTSKSLAVYYDAHNAYVQQLRGTNAMLNEYQSTTLPALLQELEEIYVDLCKTVGESVLEESQIISSRAQEASSRYENLISVCQSINGIQDLRDYVKALTLTPPPNQRHAFTLPVPLLSEAGDILDQNQVPILKNEVISAPSARTRYENVKKEMIDLHADIKQLQEAVETLVRMQQRSLDSNLFNKANELQEEISMKMFDLRLAQIHLASLRAQRDLYSPSRRAEGGGGVGGAESSSSLSSGTKDRKFQVSTTTMKSKWLKAFKSLKAPPSPPPPSLPTPPPEKKSAKEKDNNGKEFQIFENHIFQEYTYKKITPCDICSKILRGHTRQGIRCRMCKMNIHLDCQERVEKCQPKTRLLRRQRSTSELETRLTQLAESDGGSIGKGNQLRGSEEPDLIYQVLKQATDLKKPGGGGSSSGSGSGSGFLGSSQTLQSQQDLSLPSTSNRRSNPTVNVVGNQSGSTAALTQSPSFHPSSSGKRRDSYVSKKSVSADADGQSLVLLPPPRAISLPSTQTPHSPRRRKLDLRMKSFSLDSPESAEHANRRRYAQGSQSTSHSQYYWREFVGRTSAVTNRRSIDGGLLQRFVSPSNTPPFVSHFAPSSPVHNRRALLSARNVRMSSVELPDENDKSLSSASTSPCPSPKPHRLLPTNLYVVLYLFKARHPDELDLKAGYKVTVTDTTDPDWWQGKCLGRQGYFPSTYVTKLQSGEKVLQVTHNLQVTDGADSGLKLLRDQVVIQMGEECNGMVMIRNGENKQGHVPLKYLQEV